MSIALRILLIFAALFVLFFITRQIRQSKFSAKESIYWLGLCFILVIMALFPWLVYQCSNLLGIQSPSNFVFLIIIAILLVKEFSLQSEIASLRTKLTNICQVITLTNSNLDS